MTWAPESLSVLLDDVVCIVAKDTWFMYRRCAIAIKCNHEKAYQSGKFVHYGILRSRSNQAIRCHTFSHENDIAKCQRYSKPFHHRNNIENPNEMDVYLTYLFNNDCVGESFELSFQRKGGIFLMRQIQMLWKYIYLWPSVSFFSRNNT